MDTDKEILEQYYKLWAQGCTPEEIQKALPISPKKFKELQPEFLHFCQYRIKYDTKRSLNEYGHPVSIALTEDRKQEFLGYAMAGLEISKICTVMNIPPVTVFQSWFVEDPVFRTQVQQASTIASAQVSIGLHRKATGYQYPGGHRTITKGERKTTVTRKLENGAVEVFDGWEPYETIVTTEKINVVEPDTNAIKFYLANKDPDNYSMDGAKASSKNKGRIIEYLDSLSTTLDDETLEAYDREQEDFEERF